MAKKKTTARPKGAKATPKKATKGKTAKKARAAVKKKAPVPRKGKQPDKQKSQRELIPKQDIAHVYETLKNNQADLMALGTKLLGKKHPIVKGVGVGFAHRGGEMKEDAPLVISLEVATEADKQWLKDNKDKIGYKKYYDGVDTDIVVPASYKTFAAGVGLPAGELIEGPGGKGTLGGKVIVTVNDDGDEEAFYITAAHVASFLGSSPSGAIPIEQVSTGNVKGHVKQYLFRTPELDVAFIKPKPAINLEIPDPFAIAIPKVGMEVKMIGAVNRTSGKITKMMFSGTIKAFGPGGAVVNEPITNQFQVSGFNAVPGDSGSYVIKGNMLLGLVRASNGSTAICTRFDEIQRLSKVEFTTS